ncbi:MAG: hypothetical protein HY821_12235 [Acidobacteria bacterium]|nr:hypothetical protein [Acidobacteriota bacterium]
MARSILAVLAGWASVGALVVLTDLILMKLFPHGYTPGQMPSDTTSAISLFTSTAYSILGGWITAALAPSYPWRHVVALCIWGELMAGLSMAFTMGQVQIWYQLGLIALWLPAIAIGAFLRAGKPRFGPEP